MAGACGIPPSRLCRRRARVNLRRSRRRQRRASSGKGRVDGCSGARTSGGAFVRPGRVVGCVRSRRSGGRPPAEARRRGGRTGGPRAAASTVGLGARRRPTDRPAGSACADGLQNERLRDVLPAVDGPHPGGAEGNPVATLRMQVSQDDGGHAHDMESVEMRQPLASRRAKPPSARPIAGPPGANDASGGRHLRIEGGSTNDCAARSPCSYGQDEAGDQVSEFPYNPSAP